MGFRHLLAYALIALMVAAVIGGGFWYFVRHSRRSRLARQQRRERASKQRRLDEEAEAPETP